MKFIRPFQGGRCTATLVVDDGNVAVQWQGCPTRAINQEYREWIRNSLQIAANASGRKILYLCPGMAPPFIVVAPESR